MKPFHSFIFLIPSSITVLAKPFTNENVGPGPDGVKCTLSTVSVKNPKDLLTFNGYCVYSKSHDNCKTGVALLQYYDPQNVCPLEILNGQYPDQAAVPCCVHIVCGAKGEGTCINTPDSDVNDCKGTLVVDEDRCPEGKSKTMCCIPSTYENVKNEYTKEQMAAVDPGIQLYQGGLRDDKYFFGDQLLSPGVGDGELIQDEGEDGDDCLIWGIDCPVS